MGSLIDGRDQGMYDYFSSTSATDPAKDASELEGIMQEEDAVTRREAPDGFEFGWVEPEGLKAVPPKRDIHKHKATYDAGHLEGRRFQHQGDIKWLEEHTSVVKKLPYLQWQAFKKLMEKRDE